MYLTATPSRAAIAAAMSAETPEGSPDGVLPVTKRKLPMLIAARSTPVGASSETICWLGWTGMTGGSGMVTIDQGVILIIATRYARAKSRRGRCHETASQMHRSGRDER